MVIYIHFKKVVFEGELQNNSTRYHVSNSTSKRAVATEQNIPRCLTCQSTNIKKISSLSKAGSVAMWGDFLKRLRNNGIVIIVVANGKGD